MGDRRWKRVSGAGWTVLTAAAVATMGGTVLTTSAAPVSSGTRPVYVPITPCRLLDTRPAPDNVGTRVGALAAGEVFATTARGTVGKCAIPTDAVALGLNVAIVAPTADSYLTVYPADTEQPLAANLNWVAGQAPTPNAVTAKLSADGKLAFYNLKGTVHLAVDVQGYYVDSNFDDRYYTKAETDTKFATAADLTALSDAVDALEADPSPQVIVTTFIPSSLIDDLPGGGDVVVSSVAGRWQINAHVLANAVCDAGSVDRYYFWVIDGSAVPSSAFSWEDSTPIDQTVLGVSALAIPAGTHTVDLGVMCQAGSPASSISVEYSALTVTVLP